MTNNIDRFGKISLLYVCRSPLDAYLTLFSGSPAWTVAVEHEIRAVPERAAVYKPDLIVFDGLDDGFDSVLEMIRLLQEKNANKSYAIFLFLSVDPGPERRLIFFEAGGADIFIKPFLISEVFSKIQVYLHRSDLIRQNDHDQKQVTRLLKDLDVMKGQLKSTRDELTEEKDILNSSLKQINKMTQEREKMNTALLDLNNKLISNSEGVTGLLVKMIQARVEKNKGHSRRVADIALFVAKLLKITENDSKELETAAMLHETGLLLLPGKMEQSGKNEGMSPFETDFLIQSPVKGADLLTMCSQYEAAAEIIRHMNENVDGTGTPDGLKKKHIPLLSRILAGADMLDTLYDQADIRHPDEILAVLEASAGQRLDPVIVNCLEKYVVSHAGKNDFRAMGIGIPDLKPGMILAAGLFTATGTKLFSVNTLLNQEAIDKIIKYNREYPVEETVYIKA